MQMQNWNAKSKIMHFYQSDPQILTVEKLCLMKLWKWLKQTIYCDTWFTTESTSFQEKDAHLLLHLCEENVSINIY